VHIGTPIPICQAENERRLASKDTPSDSTPINKNESSITTTSTTQTEAYVPSTFDNLVYRYEEPNAMARWDSPLFTVIRDDEQPPCEAIWDAMIGSDGKGRVVRSNAATVLKPPTPQNALYALDKTTSEILSQITTWQKDHPGEDGGEISIPGVDEKIQLPVTPLNLPQLQRIRRQFIALNRVNTFEVGRVGPMFVGYLNDAFWG